MISPTSRKTVAMTTRAYSRCNGGHYFIGAYCPIDGWSSRASVELTAACQRLTASGRPISLADLLEEGVSSDSLRRIIIVEFGSEKSIFDAISPCGYVVNGKWVRIEDVDDSLL
jgi:hypothetical protein